jgi:hypothetical protein
MNKILTMLCFYMIIGFCNAQSNSAYFDTSTIQVSDSPRNPPKFSDYPVPVFAGKPTAPDVKSHPRSRLFRSKILEGAKSGPNSLDTTPLSGGAADRVAALMPSSMQKRGGFFILEVWMQSITSMWTLRPWRGAKNP